MATAPEPDFDLAAAARRVRRRARLLLLFSVCGLAAGYLAWRSGAREFRARTVLFVTQTSGIAQPAALAAIARSQSVLAATSLQTGIPVRRLAATLSATRVGTAATGGPLFFQVSVRGRRRSETLAASRLIGTALLSRIDDYQVAQTASTTAQLAESRRELASTDRRRALAETLSPGNPTVRLTALGIIQQARSTVLGRINVLRTQLAQAKAQRSLISDSSVAAVGARSPSASALVGALIGLILGVLVSLALPTRRGRSSLEASG